MQQIKKLLIHLSSPYWNTRQPIRSPGIGRKIYTAIGASILLTRVQKLLNRFAYFRYKDL